jgi:histidine triad (HIT) family protein
VVADSCRLTGVNVDSHDDCLFCGIVAGRVPSQMVYEGDNVIAFRDINPKAPFHALITPRRHIATLNDVVTEDWQLMGELVSTAAQIAAREGFAESGYRTIFNCNRDGGQTVFHIHMHLIGGGPLGGSGF